MKKKITKKEIVKLLLNQNLEEGNEEELMDSLVKEPVAIDIIKEDEESKSFRARDEAKKKYEEAIKDGRLWKALKR